MEADVLTQIREQYPLGADHLWHWVRTYTGVRIARRAVCRDHHAPFEAFSHQVLDRPRPPLSIWHANRGGGKSFLSALDSHLVSRWHPGSETQILGGSLDQSKQIYNGLKKVLRNYRGEAETGNDAASVRSLLARSASYRNGSVINILACSDLSVRGPHSPSLKLDEVDEIKEDHRDAAMGMCMAISGIDLEPNALYTSTWHRPGGPMSKLAEEAKSQAYPFYTWCMYEVLERCTEQRSGRWVGADEAYENCPICPLKPSCHAERKSPRDLPRAKKSAGHYTIDSAIQKVMTTGLQTFRSDYLCDGPKLDGIMFPTFDKYKNVSEESEYDPRFNVYEALDSGVRSGGVWFQVVNMRDSVAEWVSVRVFADYFSEDVGAYRVAKDVQAVRAERCQGKRTRSFTDPAGSYANAVGPVVLAEYERAGLVGLEHWPSYDGSVMDGIALINAFLKTDDGKVSLLIHPRCVRLIEAFQSYERRRVNGQWTDRPREPQHPHEDMIDALRGGLHGLYPDGRRPPPKLLWVPGRQVF